MGALGTDMAVLQKQSGLTEVQFAKLQSQFLQTQGEKAQETALRNIATNAKLAEKEMRALGAQMGVSRASIDRVAAGMNQVGKSTEFSMAKFRDMIITVGIYTVAFQGLSAAVGGIKNAFVFGFKSIEEFNVGIAASAAYITTFSERAKKGDLSGAYKDAAKYAKYLAETLEMVDSKTIASGKDLQIMSETFLQHSVLLDANNQKQVEGFTNIATALALVTAGQNKDIQLRQEINALMLGQERATDRLPKLLSAIDPKLQEHLKLWREQGTVIENVGGLLKSFGSETGDLDDLWATIGSTMETISKRVLRGGLEPAFNDLIGLAKELNNSLMDSEGHLTPLAESIQRDISGAYQDAKKFVDDYGKSLVRLTTFVLEVKAAQILLNLAVKANPYYIAAAAAVYLAHKYGVLSETLKIASEAIDEVVTRLAALKDVATLKDFSLWDWATTGVDGLKELNNEVKNGTAALREQKIALQERRDSVASSWAFTAESRKAKEAEIAVIDGQTAALDRQIASIQRKDSLLMSSHGAGTNDGLMPSHGAGDVQAPELSPPTATGGGSGTSKASDYNAALQAQVELLKATEERKLAVIKAASALNEQANESSYALGLKSYSAYLDKKRDLTEKGLQQELAARQKELDAAQDAAGKLSPITDKEGNVRPDKNEKARADALKKVEDATRSVIEAQNKLDLARKEGAFDAQKYADDQVKAYKEVEIQLLEMRGLDVEAAAARAEFDKQSIDRQRLLAAAREGDYAAQRQLFSLEQMSAIEASSVSMDRLARSKEATLGIADLNHEYRQSREIQIQLLDIEIQRAELSKGSIPEEIALLKEQKRQLEELNSGTVNWVESLKYGLKDVQEETSKIGEAISGTLTDAFDESTDALVEFAKTGKLNLDNFFDSILDNLLRIVIMQAQNAAVSGFLNFAFGGSSTTSGLTGIAGNSSMNWGGRHSGGVVGSDSPTFTRSLSAGLLNQAPRLHTGLMPDEFPAILQKGEAVFTKGQMAALGGGGGNGGRPVFNLVVNNNTDSTIDQKEKDNGTGGLDIEMIIDAVNAKNVARRGSASNRAVRSAVGSQLVSR
jgi:hypothetical protein